MVTLFFIKWRVIFDYVLNQNIEYIDKIVALHLNCLLTVTELYK